MTAFLALAIVLLGAVLGLRARDEASSPPPAARAAAPSSARGGGGPTVDIRFQDVMAGIVWMDAYPELRLSREQARRMAPDVKIMADHLEQLWQLQMRMNTQFRADQWNFIHDRRWTDLSRLDVPIPQPYADMADPLKTVRYARSIALAGTARPTGSPDVLYTPRVQDGLSWFHLSQGTVLFEARYPQLAISPTQARALTPLFTDLERIMSTVEDKEHTLVAMLNDKQRQWILDQKNGRAVDQVDGRPILDGRQQPSTAKVVEVVEERAK